MTVRYPKSSALIALSLLVGCGADREEDRQPSASEVKAYIAKIERDEAKAKADAIGKSRAKEEVQDREHLARVPAQD